MSVAVSRSETDLAPHCDNPGADRTADVDLSPHPSPARRLQDQLQARRPPFPEPEPGRWPGVIRVAVIMGGSLALWRGLIATGLTAVKPFLR